MSHHHSTSALGEWNYYKHAPDSEKKEKINAVIMANVRNKITYGQYDLQTVRRQCAKYTYIYSVHTVYYKDIVIDPHYTLYVHVYIMYTSIHSIMWGATDYTFTADGCAKGANRLCICNVVNVHCMVSSDSRCVSAVCVCSPVGNCVKVQCMSCCVSGSVMWGELFMTVH